MSTNNYITNNSIESIQKQINMKNSSKPYYATTKTVEHVVTDMDVFPYTRFNRSQPMNENPIVFEREAGYRQVHSYTPHVDLPADPEPNVCFKPACNTITPCLANTESNQRIIDRNNELNKMIQHNISV
jgi:hypothetical protein